MAADANCLICHGCNPCIIDGCLYFVLCRGHKCPRCVKGRWTVFISPASTDSSLCKLKDYKEKKQRWPPRSVEGDNLRTVIGQPTISKMALPCKQDRQL